MSEKDMEYVEDAFVAAVDRCRTAGCSSLSSPLFHFADIYFNTVDFIEIHAAHGYLLHSWLSPLSNLRTDAHGGALENRMRYPLRLIERVRTAWDKPLFVRISASDFAEGPEKGADGKWANWGIEQSKVLVGEMAKLGVDLVDVSAGGNWQQQKIKLGPGYQVRGALACCVGLVFALIVRRCHLRKRSRRRIRT